jgi:3-oxoacyl-[acyl-carrier-protein] synthase-3
VALRGIVAVKYAAIGPIAVYLPPRVETNAQLQAEHPEWDMELIASKTGVYARHIADPNECSSDLAVAAAERLFAEFGIDRDSIDFLLLCTQTPDYPLPTTACLVQERLRLSTTVGALDFNLGCSGFVYGLSLADGLIQSGAARRVLLITAETYSKFIAPQDRSLRTIFGDGAAATLVDASSKPTLGGFVFSTDGRGADTLLVNRGGARLPEHAIRPRGRWRWPSMLYMDGPSLIQITIEAIPRLVDDVLAKGQWNKAAVELFLMHQATRLMLDQLRNHLHIEPARMPLCLRDCGNTVSSTLPLLIDDLRRSGRLRPGVRSVMVGFGVGYSSAGCTWIESWAA